MNGQDASAAHSVLQYMISRALLQGKIGKTVVEIPMIDMTNKYEGPQVEMEALDLVLKVTINTEWSDGDPEGGLETDVLDDDEEIGAL